MKEPASPVLDLLVDAIPAPHLHLKERHMLKIAQVGVP